jgi:threonine dehydrogenase-like Zn-dependent dehydrogenase
MTFPARKVSLSAVSYPSDWWLSRSGFYLSDILPVAYNCVVNTDAKKGATVVVWGMGPIGLMAAHFTFKKGASRVVGNDNNWRLDWCKSKLPKLETLNLAQIPSSVPTELRTGRRSRIRMHCWGVREGYPP